MYLTYEEYQDLGGKLDETTFIMLEFDASKYIDYYTFDRLKDFTTIPDDVKMCIMRILDFVEQTQSLGGTLGENASAVASMSNDGVSISYNVLNAQETLSSSKQSISETIKRYLTNVKDAKGQSILYRGVY